MVKYPRPAHGSVILLMLYVLPVFAGEEIIYNKVNLQAQVQQDIPNDLMKVILEVEHQGNQPSTLAEKINMDMQWALERSNRKPDIRSSTGVYHTYPVYREQQVIGWRSSQQLELESENIAGLTELVGILQEKLQVKQMGFSPSRVTQLRYEDELIEEAMKAFKNKAEIIRKYMDDMNYRVVELHVNTGNQRPPGVYAERAMVQAMDARQAPAVEAGTSVLSVTVSGSVQYFQ